MRLRIVSSASILLACSLLAVNLGFAQTPPKPANPPAPPSAVGSPPPPAASAPPAVFKSTAALVLVDVLVSNGAEPIHGIPRAQFHLLEDGKEQKLIALEEHKAVDPSTVQKPPELPPNIYSNIPETQMPSAVNAVHDLTSDRIGAVEIPLMVKPPVK